MESEGGSPQPQQQVTSSPKSPEFKYGGDKTKFEPSFLISKPEDLLKIKDRELRRRVHLLHNAFVEDPNTLTVDELRSEAKELRNGIASGKYKSQDAEPISKKLRGQANKIEASKDAEQKPSSAFPQTDERINAVLHDLEVAGLTLLGDQVVDNSGKVVGKLADFVGGKLGNLLGKKEPKAEQSVQQRKEPTAPQASTSPEQNKTPSGHEYRNFSTMSYSQLRLALQDPKLSQNSKDLVREAMKNLENELKSFDNGDPYREFQDKVQLHVETHNWDDLQRGPESLNSKKKVWATEFAGASGYNKKWDGIIETAIEGTAAQLLLDGIQQRTDQIANSVQGVRPEDTQEYQEFRMRNKFTDDEIARLNRIAADKNIFPDLLGDVPELLVGSQLEGVTDAAYQRLNQPQTQTPDVMLQLLNEVRTGNQLTAQQMALYQQQMESLADAFKGGSTEKEVENWVELEYRQEFWARFEPRSWPKFYENASPEERRKIDSRWKLARAAFYKKNTSAFPEKQIENGDLASMQKEEMKTLYETNGAREMMQGYASALVKNEKFMIYVGKDRRGRAKYEQKSLFECEDETQFEQVRNQLRIKYLQRNENFEKRAMEDFGRKEGNGDSIDPTKKEYALRVARKVADSVAWNLIWVSNLVESLDSRYGSVPIPGSPETNGISGGRHAGLPGVLVSDDIRALFHPQEKFEAKCWSSLEWGAFGKWGKTQTDSFKSSFGVSGDDKVIFVPAANASEFWTGYQSGWDVVGTKRVKVWTIKTPECYPVKSLGSFLESTKVADNRGRESTLLNYLVDNIDVPWDNFGSDPWIPYLAISFNKAVSEDEYFAGKKPLEERKEIDWARSLNDAFSRLKIEVALNKMDSIDVGTRKQTYQTLSKLRTWAVYASMGINAPTNRIPDLALTGFDKAVMNSRLRQSQINFLSRQDTLDLKRI